MPKHVTSIRKVTAIPTKAQEYQAYCLCGWESSRMRYESEAALYAAGHRRVMKERESHNAL